jgi:hypothetical protein
MTTGRINQVTTIRNAWEGASTPCYQLPRGCFHSTGVHQQIRSHLQIQKGKAIITDQPSALERTSKSHNQRPDHLVPRSHKIQAHFSLSFEETEIMAFGEDYQQPAAPERHAAVTADPRVVILTDGFGHRQAIHIPLSS